MNVGFIDVHYFLKLEPKAAFCEEGASEEHVKGCVAER